MAEQLRKRFETEEWMAAHADKSIHQIIVTYSDHAEISERGLVDHEFSPLTGKMSSYSYMTLARDQACISLPFMPQRQSLVLTVQPPPFHPTPLRTLPLR